MKNSFFCLFLCLILSCDYYDGRLNVVNQTKNAICITTEKDTFLEYPDINVKEIYLDKCILPYDTQSFDMPGAWDAWEQYTNDSKDSTMSLFIFDVDTVKKYPWDTVRKNGMYLKRFDINVKMLKAMNWIITYK